MHYVGSKKRMKNDLLQIFSKYRKKGQLYIEPFVGGCNSIDIMENPRWGNDSHYELIEMFRAIQKGWIPPDKITEEDYYSVKENRDKIHPALVGFVGFCCSFGGKYWGGFGRREGQKSTCQQNRTVLLKQAPLLRDIRLTNMNYLDMKYPGIASYILTHHMKIQYNIKQENRSQAVSFGIGQNIWARVGIMSSCLNTQSQKVENSKKYFKRKCRVTWYTETVKLN